MKYYIKVITGFREDQQFTISMQEAHKAYYLFKHPNSRGVFDNGVALVGKNIQGIQPDWNKTMGYNPDYELNEDDWNDIKGKSFDKKMQKLLEKAKEIGDLMEEKPMLGKLDLIDALPLIDVEENLALKENIKALADKMDGGLSDNNK